MLGKELTKFIGNQCVCPMVFGSVVAFLGIDDAKWVNAQRIEVSGGIHL